MTMDFTISALEQKHKKGWLELYRSYAEFYQVATNDAKLETLWEWIFDDDNPMQSIIAVDQHSIPKAFMHFWAMPSPFRASFIGFLDDFFIHPDARGSNLSHAMMERLKQIGHQNQWQIIRWNTDENNYRARSLYDKVANKTHWNTYEMPC